MILSPFALLVLENVFLWESGESLGDKNVYEIFALWKFADWAGVHFSELCEGKIYSLTIWVMTDQHRQGSSRCSKALAKMFCFSIG